MINENLANGGLVSNENLIILSNSQKTISSLDLCNLINKIRKEEGVRAELQHKDLLKKINEELEEISEKFRSSYIDSMNREKPCYNLPQKEALQVIASESKRVRRRLIDEIERLTNENNQLKQEQQFKLPQNYKEALLELVSKVEENEKLSNEIQEKQNFIEVIQDTKEEKFFKKTLRSEVVQIVNHIQKATGMLHNEIYRVLYQRFMNLYPNISWKYEFFASNKKMDFITAKNMNIRYIKDLKDVAVAMSKEIRGCPMADINN